MENFRKVVNPCQCLVWNQRGTGQYLVPAYAKIEYKDGKLSICGVVGPRSNGDCAGSAGQCVEAIREGSPVGYWTAEMLTKFCDIWDKWHLNDMRPYCEHQKALGWDKLATKKVTLYNYTLRNEWFSTKRKLHNEVKKILGETGQVFLTEDERETWNLPLSVHTWKPLDDMRYEPQKKTERNDGPTEEKALGWLKPEEHPEGILGKPCPVCGYKYGTSWLREEVPEDVLQFLYSLPNTTKQPAWV